MNKNYKLGIKAFKIYYTSLDSSYSVKSGTIPPWSHVPERIRNAWQTVAEEMSKINLPKTKSKININEQINTIIDATKASIVVEKKSNQFKRRSK